MKITVFSSNQPRHLSLVSDLSNIADEVFFISEVNTIFPGKVDDFFKKSNLMRIYFNKVLKAEKKIFGKINFVSDNIRFLSIKNGDLSGLERHSLKQALLSDIYIVFGASFIKGWLIDFLIKKKALNIHMGLSPYYRGSSCNFWALYDNNPSYVGATIHLLSKGLDSGKILFHCIPNSNKHKNLFDFTMDSVSVAHKGIISYIDRNKKIEPVNQLKSKQIRYTRNVDFNDFVVRDFFKKKINLKRTLIYPDLIKPFML